MSGCQNICVSFFYVSNTNTHTHSQPCPLVVASREPSLILYLRHFSTFRFFSFLLFIWKHIYALVQIASLYKERAVLATEYTMKQQVLEAEIKEAESAVEALGSAETATAAVQQLKDKVLSVYVFVFET